MVGRRFAMAMFITLKTRKPATTNAMSETISVALRVRLIAWSARSARKSGFITDTRPPSAESRSVRSVSPSPRTKIESS